MADQITVSLALKLRYQLVLPLLSRLPRRSAYRLATLYSRLSENTIHPGERSAILQQMQRIFPDHPHEQIQHYIRYHFGMVEREYLDTWVFPRLRTIEEIDRFVTLKGFEPLKQAREEGRRVMLTGGHFGHFWMAGIGMNAHGVAVGTLTRDGGEENHHGLPTEEFNFRLKKLKWLQQALGGPFLVSGNNLRPIYRALDHYVMALLIDVPYEYAHPGLVEVPFLGKSGWFADGIARVAQRTEALIFPYFVTEERQGLTATFEPPLEAAAMKPETIMEQLVRRLEEKILQQPAQWWLWPALPLIHREITS
ncbi:MAG: lysophospholipid acyltransferase family protein [Gammaproteobacteria bacterium]|nr:lysophospholipid acyltransferase family protein [Gammaproteobacteria bacterium]